MTLWFTLLAVVLTISALVAGIVARAPLTFPLLFLGLGLLLGKGGIGLITMDLDSPALEAIATVDLALVLFLDAVKLQPEELRQGWRAPLLSLGPGTLLVIGGVAVAAHLLVGMSWLYALLLGAVLASTDPVVLRDVVNNEQLPRSIRRVLGIEAGMNDIVVLPIVLVLIEVLRAEGGGATSWLAFLAELLLLSPLVGLTVGGVGAWLMGKADARFAVSREYQSLYGLGLVLGAFVAAQAVGGDGFLAAFFAGLAVALFDVTLCECFLDYGEVTAEMAMLLAFILFGVVLSTLLGSISLLPALALAVVALGMVRPLALGLVFTRAKMSLAAKAFIGWFGPRGLSSLLLALLVVQAHVPNAVRLFSIAGLVVLVSAIAHGVSATPVSAWYARRIAQARPTMPEEREASASGLFEEEASDVPRITPEELAHQLAGEHPPVVLDVRARAAYNQESGQIPGSQRVPPDQIEEWAASASKERPVVTYCT